MEPLTPNISSLLNVYTINLLKKQRITTVGEFLRADSKKLIETINLGYDELDIIKKDLSKYVGIAPIDGGQHYQLLAQQSIPLQTGITSLDEMLNGGFLPGNIIDLCGLSGSGKTQIYTTIALNVAINQKLETFIIDTKGDFSGERIYQMLCHRKITDTDKCQEIMNRIKIERCNDPTKLIDIVKNLMENIDSFKKFRILVIDSLPALWFLYHGNKNSKGHQNLSKLSNLLRKLAVEHAIIILTVNIVTRWIKNSIGEQNPNNEHDSSLNNSMSFTPPTVNNVLMPALGKFWQSACSHRLLIQRSTMAPCNQRIIQILKSNQFKTGINCTIHLTDDGVS